MRKTFEIQYRDPQTGFIETIRETFEDSQVGCAKMWAEDYAYTLADKGWYRLKELKGPLDGPPNTMVGLFDTERQ